jgi:hypothetical protein
MAEVEIKTKTLGEKAADEVFEKHNEIHCTQCRDVFVVEELTSKHSWRCPHCEKQNPNLYFYFLIIGVILAIGIIANLTFLIMYMNAVRQDVNVFFVMWSAAHMLLIGYVLIALFGDKHSYSLIPLRYLIPIVYVSAVLSAIAYQIEFSMANLIVGGIIFGGIGASIGYAFYLSYRMVEGHRAEESIVRPVYSMISIALNVVLLLIFTTIAIKTAKRTPGTSSIEMGTPGGFVPTVENKKDVEEKIEEIKKEEIEIEDPQIRPDIRDIEMPELKPVIPFVSTNPMTYVYKTIEQKAVPKVSKSVVRNPKYRQRLDREIMLKEGGGSDKTEWAVLLALRWLKKHQNEDGSWGEEPYKPSMTGLALLAFLGHGEDHLSPEFGSTVRSAMDWFVNVQDEKGYFAEVQRGYQHGIATYAMTEAYGMTTLEDLLPVVDQALRRIMEGQTSRGGWRYQYIATVDDNDLSVTGWQIQALKAAHTAGITYSDGRLQKAMANAAKYVQGNYSQTGQLFGYDGPGGSSAENYAMTPTGTLCMQFLGRNSSSEVRGALDQMRKNYKFEWKETAGGRLFVPLYAWYYATQAFYQATDTPSTNPYWRFWNGQMQNTLLTKQNKDGSWPLPEQSRIKTNIGEKNSEVWATAFCCMMLEVYYRYLPTYKLVD